MAVALAKNKKSAKKNNKQKKNRTDRTAEHAEPSSHGPMAAFPKAFSTVVLFVDGF